MKKCYTCKIEKEESEFNKNSSRKDKLNSICRVCSNQRSLRYYKENGAKHRNVISARKKKLISINKNKLLNILKEAECKDCGNKDHRTFEFDHISNNKFKNVVSLLGQGYSWEKVEKEMKKCEIVCANCHRIRTYKRFNSYRLDLNNSNLA